MFKLLPAKGWERGPRTLEAVLANETISLSCINPPWLPCAASMCGEWKESLSLAARGPSAATVGDETAADRVGNQRRGRVSLGEAGLGIGGPQGRSASRGGWFETDRTSVSVW